MRGGSNKKNADAHRAAGTYRKDRHEKPATSFLTIAPLKELPTPPDTLPGGMEKDWNRVCKLLQDNGILFQTDLDMVALYVSKLWIYRKAMREVEENGLVVTTINGNGIPSDRENPNLKIAMDAAKEIRQIADRFGFSPAARSRVKIDASQEEKDPFAELMQKTYERRQQMPKA